MMQTETLRVSEAASARWPSRAALTMPDPYEAGAPAVVRYVEALQQADQALAAELAAMPTSPDTARRQAQRARVDAAIHRQVLLAARRMGTARADSLAALNGIFALGHAPDPALDGPYQGTGITSTLWAPLDSLSRVLAHLWLPWKGKRLMAATQSGDNMFPAEDMWIGRLAWPTYHAYQPYRPGLVTGFTFHTYTGPGVCDPQVSTLKLDYALPSNPRLLIRSVLDEVVQLSGGYYFGKAYLVLPRAENRYLLAAFFTLRPTE
jgi:hypothetical protein